MYCLLRLPSSFVRPCQDPASRGTGVQCGAQVCNAHHGLPALCTRAAAAACHVPSPGPYQKESLTEVNVQGQSAGPEKGACGRLRRINAQSEEPTIGSVDSTAWPARGLACASCPLSS